jgi:GrpB-like predicted nucleotidyltransferase (UPF0157 family)
MHVGATAISTASNEIMVEAAKQISIDILDMCTTVSNILSQCRSKRPLKTQGFVIYDEEKLSLRQNPS